MPAQAESTVGRDWVWPSAVNWRTCWAAKSSWPASLAKAAFTLYLPQTYAGRRWRARGFRNSRDEVLPTASTETVRRSRQYRGKGIRCCSFIEDDPHYAAGVVGACPATGASRAWWPCGAALLSRWRGNSSPLQLASTSSCQICWDGPY